MEKNSKEFPWANIWMMAFAVAGIWLAWPQSEWQPDWYDAMRVVVPLTFVFLVGFLTMPISFWYGRGEDHRLTLNDIGRVYLDSARQVFRQGWILWLFGSVLAAGLIFGFLQTWLVHAQFDAANGAMGVWHPSIVSFAENWRLVLPPWLATSTNASVVRFLPDPGQGTGTAPALILLIFLVWAAGRAKGWRSDPERSAKGQALRRLLLTGMAILVPSLATTAAAIVIFLPHPGRTEVPTIGMLVFSVVETSISALIAAVFSAVFVAGLGGSLLRVGRRQQVTADSWLEDVVCYVVPMVGVYLMLAAVEVASSSLTNIPFLLQYARASMPSTDQAVSRVTLHILQVAWILAMFAPFAVTTRRAGSLRAIKMGLRDWFTNAGNVLSFVALGISLASTALMLNGLAAQFLAASGQPAILPPLPVDMLHLLFARTLGMLVTAIMTVAVWNFYLRITREGTSDTTV